MVQVAKSTPPPTPDALEPPTTCLLILLIISQLIPTLSEMLPPFKSTFSIPPTHLYIHIPKKAQDPTSEASTKNTHQAIMSTPNPKAFPLANAQLTNQVCLIP
jgi:hypothetical protein